MEGFYFLHCLLGSCQDFSLEKLHSIRQDPRKDQFALFSAWVERFQLVCRTWSLVSAWLWGSCDQVLNSLIDPFVWNLDSSSMIWELAPLVCPSGNRNRQPSSLADFRRLMRPMILWKSICEQRFTLALLLFEVELLLDWPSPSPPAPPSISSNSSSPTRSLISRQQRPPSPTPPFEMHHFIPRGSDCGSWVHFNTSLLECQPIGYIESSDQLGIANRLTEVVGPSRHTSSWTLPAFDGRSAYPPQIVATYLIDQF